MPDQPPGGAGPEAAAPRAAPKMPDQPPVDIKAIFDLKPAEAIAFLRAKRPQITVAWSEMLHEEHGAAFTVAHVAKLDLLDDMQASLVQAEEDGVPFEQWQAEIKPTLIDKGWWGLVTDETITGTADPVFIGPRRLRTIYDTNLRMSRAKGQWSRIQAIKAKRPFLRYSAVMDSRTRPQHAAWHGTILPVDHVFWLTHFPPCGWRCRCTAQQLSQRDLDHRGWHVTPDAKVPDLTATVPFYRKGATTPIFVPRGVDPGFAYNPGISRNESASTKAAQSLIDAHAAGNGDAAAAVLDELLGDAAPAKLPDSAVPALLRLIEAGDRDGLAKLLAALIGADVATTAVLLAAETASSRGKRRKKHGTGGSHGNNAWASQPRQAAGRWGFKPGAATTPHHASPAFIAGPMPVGKINATLGTSLAPGNIRVSATIHAKVKSGKHAEDYPVLKRNLAAITNSPDLIGRDPNHPDKIALIKAVTGLSRGRTHMILPVYQGTDRHGDYGAASGFGLNPNQLRDRIAKGWYLPVKP